jgi:hypothetical protein
VTQHRVMTAPGFRFHLVHTLIEQDLVDELRLKDLPGRARRRERLFAQTSDKRPMRLVDSQTIDGDIVLLTYESVRDA